MEEGNVLVEGDAMMTAEGIDLVVWGQLHMVQVLWDRSDMGLVGEDPAHSRCGRRQMVEGENLGHDSSFHVDGHPPSFTPSHQSTDLASSSQLPLYPVSAHFFLHLAHLSKELFKLIGVMWGVSRIVEAQTSFSRTTKVEVTRL